MCLCKREVDQGRLAGPSDRELAAKWARLVMIGPDNFAERLARRGIASGLRAPVEQVRVARRVFEHLSQALG